MRVAVIGYNIEGKSAVSYWLKQGAEVTVCKRTETTGLPPEVQLRYGEGYLKNLDTFDVICRTGSVHPSLILAANTGVGDKITTVINEFFRVSPTKNIIGVTGTKGKGTTATLIYKMLQVAGKHVFLAGNIGNSPLDFVDQLTPDSWVVLELSSYQLYDLKQSPHIGVCLMVAPEHLDWHGNIEDYTKSKAQLFAHQTASDIAIYFADNQTSHQIASTSPGAKIPYYAVPGAYIEDDTYLTIDEQRVCEVSEIKLAGRHNWQNACAAVTVFWQILREIEPPRAVLLNFSGLPHRLEFVREFEKVTYVDDSFGTTPETAIAALEVFEQPKVIILGGSDKGTSFDELAAAVKSSNVRQVVLIGQMAPVIQAALEGAGYANFVAGGSTMTDIVAKARSYAKPGDVVLLSPGCASFGMFNNYKDRGEQFKAAVIALA